MKLKYISDATLDENLKQLVLGEGEVLGKILSHIVEVDRIKLYLKMAYASLFEYLTKHIGYANGSAQRRIDAARLFNEIPEVITSVESGAVNLAQIALLQKGIRQAQVQNRSKVLTAAKQNLFDQIKEKTLTESELLINQNLNIEIKKDTAVTTQRNESVRLEMTLTKEQWKKMCRMRELLSNSLPHGSGWDQVLEFLSDKVISQKENRPGVTRKANISKPTNTNKDKYEDKVEDKNNSKNNIHIGPRAIIAKSVQHQIFNRDRCCQYKDNITGRTCHSKWKLNFDHITPVWAGGNNHESNLRILCAAHNQMIYKEQASLRRF